MFKFFSKSFTNCLGNVFKCKMLSSSSESSLGSVSPLSSSSSASSLEIPRRQTGMSSDSDSLDDEVFTDFHVTQPPLSLASFLEMEEIQHVCKIPMLSEDDIAHVLSFLSIKDIKNCRLVNKLWNEACLRVIPTKSYLARIPISDKVLSDVIHLQNAVGSNYQFPWTNFQVDAEKITSANKEKALVKFIETVAPFVTGFQITNLGERLFSETFDYPVLKRLSLHYPRSQESHYRSLGFVLGIVEKAPNLEELYLNGFRMMTNFVKILERENGRKIKRLTFKSIIEDKHLNRLSEVGLKLEHLSLEFDTKRFYHPTTTSGGIQAFLESQRRHLKQLELCTEDEDFYDLENATRIELPRMEKLTRLKILMHSKFLNVNYVNIFPVLRKLEFGVDTGPKALESFFTVNMMSVETVEELKFPEDMLDCQIILYASRQFPNLKKIHLANNRELLTCVSMSMAKVEEMWLLCGNQNQLDANLTGLSNDAFRLIRQSPKNLLKMWETNWQPNCWFKNVKKLALVSERIGERRRHLGITNFGCRFGLLKLERLETLVLIGECPNVSKKVMKALENKFSVQKE